MVTKGFVYIMSNDSMPGLIKVGMSTKVPEERAKELSSDTSTPTPFVVEYYALFDDMRKAEKLAHQKLKVYHHGKEFFKTNVAQAIHAIENNGLPFTKLHSKSENDKEAFSIEQKAHYKEKLNKAWEENKKNNLDQAYVDYWENHWKKKSDDQ